MTSIDLKPNESSPTRPAAEHRKSVLFCPVCGHENPVDGDWEVTVGDGGHEFGCPECGQVVAVR